VNKADLLKLEEKIMKKIFILICISILLLGASACSAVTATQTASSSATVDVSLSTNDGRYLSTAFTNASPVQLQLAVGTLKLQGTPDEIDAQTAAKLLPLWKAVYSLGNSDTTSKLEMQAIYKQIQETMTADQINTIAEMKITPEVTSQVVQELGLAAAASPAAAATGSTSQAGSAMAAGDPGMGGPPDGMGAIIGPDGGQPQMSDTTQSITVSSTSLDQTIYEAVITLLKTKAV
jgi:hypothetical protein